MAALTKGMALGPSDDGVRAFRGILTTAAISIALLLALCWWMWSQG